MNCSTNNSNRRASRFVTVFLLLASVATPGWAQPVQQHPSADSMKPNVVVVVLMDNFGWGEMDVYGGGVPRGAAMPRIDKLASEGMRLFFPSNSFLALVDSVQAGSSTAG